MPEAAPDINAILPCNRFISRFFHPYGRFHQL
jgi:hypothetical protein